MSDAPSQNLRGALTQALVSTPGPVRRLRSRRWGLDALRGRTPTLELYYEAGDPHSRLCAQLLPLLHRRLKTGLRVHVVGQPEALLYPEAQRQREFALQDAVRIAPAWDLEFPHDARLASEGVKQAVAAELVTAIGVEEFIEREAALSASLWNGAAVEAGEIRNTATALIGANEKRRRRLGHYLPGMWHFDGEWFWGVDRLHHLERRLRARGLLEGEQAIACFDASRARLPQLDATPPSLEFYFSFRSPYSYLAAEQMRVLQPRLGVPLKVRPVLPMAMRGLKVPSDKRLYIVRDVYREAQSLGIPFGRIADPIGDGARRCLTVFPQIDDVDHQLAFLCAASRAAWSQAVDLASESGLRYVCASAGLDWTQVSQTLEAAAPLDYAEDNRKALFDAGFWGVPSFRLGTFSTWGRDRLWMVEEVLRRSGLLSAE